MRMATPWMRDDLTALRVFNASEDERYGGLQATARGAARAARARNWDEARVSAAVQRLPSAGAPRRVEGCPIAFARRCDR